MEKVTSSVACPYTSKSVYYETNIVTKTKEVPMVSYTPTTIVNYKSKTLTSTQTKPYEECVTSTIAMSSAYPVYNKYTSTYYQTSVYPTATSTCKAPGYGY